MFQRIQNWLASRTLCNKLTLDRDVGVVSFSFDDALHSACQGGRKVLERLDCRGTWYIAGALTNQVASGRPYHSVSDMEELVTMGHQIGCHTYSHQACNRLTVGELDEDLMRNVEFFKQIGLPFSDLHFSFPFGVFNCASKRLAATRFKSSRIVGGGIQFGSADLNGLRSVQLYQNSIAPPTLSALTKDVATNRGWLIFQTHDVEDAPSQWGCTENLLDYAIRAALDAGCKVLPIDQAIEYFEKDKDVCHQSSS
jgi:peptidoglycan/xylan/chitin deacetylase (PgdA/CDA1 family)